MKTNRFIETCVKLHSAEWRSICKRMAMAEHNPELIPPEVRRAYGNIGPEGWRAVRVYITGRRSRETKQRLKQAQLERILSRREYMREYMRQRRNKLSNETVG